MHCSVGGGVSSGQGSVVGRVARPWDNDVGDTNMAR